MPQLPRVVARVNFYKIRATTINDDTNKLYIKITKKMKKEEEFVDFKLEETTYKTKLTKKYKNRKKWKAIDEKEIRAFLPGTIMEVKVKAKDKVKEGDLLLVVESMKMMNKIFAEFDGTIKNVLVKEKQAIPKSELLIEFE